MNSRRILSFLALILPFAFQAAAQGSHIPGPDEYSSFPAFITDRNIFDPNRQAHSSGTTHHHTTRHRTPVSAPAFSYAGAMSYEKGLFAFFAGNDPDYRAVLTTNQSIAGYTVTAVTLTNVLLVSADGKQHQELKVGDMLRQDGTQWEYVPVAERPDTAWSPPDDNHRADSSSAPASTSADGSDNTAPAPSISADHAPNDILKRLMEQRQKENQ